MTLFARLIQWVTTWLLEKLVAGIRQWIQEKSDQRRREQEIKDALKPYLASKTPEEQENAFKDLLSHMRGE